jgi:hypothetical protein
MDKEASSATVIQLDATNKLATCLVSSSSGAGAACHKQATVARQPAALLRIDSSTGPSSSPSTSLPICPAQRLKNNVNEHSHLVPDARQHWEDPSLA